MKGQSNEVKAIEFSDTESTIIYLKGGDYLINGEAYKIDGYDWQEKKLEIKDLQDIRKIKTKSILKEYQDKDGNILSIEDYIAELKTLESKGGYGYDEYLEFKDLDDEYAHKKFKRKWNAIHTTVQSISEPLIVSKKVMKLDTGNSFIKNAFGSIKGKDLSVYQYSQASARIDIVRNKMSELGMQYMDKVTYSQTEGKKIYSISSHSGIRYTVAFNNYIFGDYSEGRMLITDTYENCMKMYEDDKKWIDGVIQKGYSKHFYKGDLQNISVDALLKKLKFTKSNLQKVNPFKKTIHEYNSANKSLREAIELLEKSYKED